MEGWSDPVLLSHDALNTLPGSITCSSKRAKDHCVDDLVGTIPTTWVNLSRHDCAGLVLTKVIDALETIRTLANDQALEIFDPIN